MSRSGSSRTRFRDIFNLLLSPANHEILALLSSGEYNTREIARILGRDEADVSRRLSRMRELGLVEARWVKVSGRNVKLYRLKARRIIIDFTHGGGIRFSLETERSVSSETMDLDLSRVGYPKAEIFIGRSRELGILADKSKPVIIVYGLAGVGKTTLVSHYFNSLEDVPRYWHSFSELDYYDFLVKKLALYLSSQGYSRLLEIIASGNTNPRLLADSLTEGLESIGAVIVFDDYHKCRDNRLRSLISHLVDRVRNSKLIIISRQLPAELASSTNTVSILLPGLSPREALKLLESYGVKVPASEFAEIYAATQGHPGLLRLIAEIALKKGLEEIKKLIVKGDLSIRLWKTLYSYLDVNERELVQILSCFDEPVPRDLLSDITKYPRLLDRVVYNLVDKGLLSVRENQYRLHDLIHGLVKILRKNYDCSRCYRVAGDYYLGLGGVEDYLKALRYYALAQFSKGIIEAVNYRVGRLRYQMEDYMEPYRNLIEGIIDLIDDPRAKGYLYHELASIYLNLDKYDKAKEYYTLALGLLSPVKDRFVLALVHARMILVTELKPDIEEARRHARRALELAEEIEEPYKYVVESAVHANLGRIYAYSNMMDKAYEEIEKEYRITLKIGDPYEEAVSRFHLAIAKYMVGRKEEAIKDLLEVLRVFQLLGLKSKELMLFSVLGQAFFEQGQYVYAEEYSRKAYEGLVKNRAIMDACNIANYMVASQLILGREPDEKVLEWMDENCNRYAFSECIVAKLLVGIIYSRSIDSLSEVLEAAGEKAEFIKAMDKELVKFLFRLAEDRNPVLAAQLREIFG